MRPLAFRIRHFRSIIDSGVCDFSGDAITVLAGQNEWGKTAVLSALRDFDLDAGEAPATPDFLPEGMDDAQPEVWVQFSIEAADFDDAVKEDSLTPPIGMREKLLALSSVWIVRDMVKGMFDLAPPMRDEWAAAIASYGDEATGWCSSATVATSLRRDWPQFVYFDTFADTLPREIAVAQLTEPNCPQIVKDFLLLANIDPKRVVHLAENTKALNNYLDRQSEEVTTDFLTYWKQRGSVDQPARLHARAHRDASGAQKLGFFVRDRLDQYPDQRSKGFLWFLSFYLRLAASARDAVKLAAGHLILVDEPGSYLHARAQRDILHLFEDRLTSSKGSVVYTTHSPYLLPADKLHRIRIVLKDGAKGTLVLDRLTHPAIRGHESADTLSPVLTSLGMDIRQALQFVRPKNLLVEGITDFIYITRWAARFQPSVSEAVNVFPSFGAGEVPKMASLFIGWGLPFAVLLDRDRNADAAKTTLQRDLLIDPSQIVQPNGATAIEDIFSAEDFRRLLQTLDPALTLESDERPSRAIERQKIDKVLLARRFAELDTPDATYTGKTRTSIERLLKDILNAIPEVRVQ
jgi:hypothetical protein